MTKKVSDMTRRELEEKMYAGTVPGARKPTPAVEQILRELEEERLWEECSERRPFAPDAAMGMSPATPPWRQFRGMTLPVFRR